MSASISNSLTLRNPTHSGLTDAQIRNFAPSVFTDHARSNMSDRYQFVPTYELLAEMRQQGFVPTEVQVYNRKIPEYRPYAMHLIRFSEPGAKGTLKVVGDTAPQIIMRNSHDGSSLLELYNGVFRLVCANGLVVSDSSAVQPVRVKHASNPVLEAMFVVQELASRTKAVFEHIDAMRATPMTEKQQLSFAREALKLHAGVSVIDPAAMLGNVRRPEDKGNDVWHVFNRIQEHLVRGGLEGVTAANRRTVTRGTATMYRQLEVNAALWTLAMDAIGHASDSSRSAVRALAKATAIDAEFTETVLA